MRISFCALAVAVFASSVVTAEQVRFDAQILEEKIFAVHATHVPPNGQLKAGLGGCDSVQHQAWGKTLNNSRPLVYFSLTELVREEEDGGIWQEAPFVVLTPLRNLIPQLVQLNCSDMFILGDFSLTEDSIVIVKEGYQDQLAQLSCQVLVTSGPMREAVDATVSAEGGLHIETQMVGEFYFSFDGKPQIPSEFFAALHQRHPYLIIDDNDENGALHKQAQAFLYVCNSAPYSLYFLNDSGMDEPSSFELLHCLQQCRESLALIEEYEMRKHDVFNGAIRRAVDSNTRILNLLELELYLREEYGKSLRGLYRTRPDLLSELYDVALNSNSLILWATDRLSELQNY